MTGNIEGHRQAALPLASAAGQGRSLPYHFGERQRKTRALMTRVITDALPGAALADPLLQLRRAVTASGGGDHGGILALLTRMSPVFAANADIRVQSLEYSHDSGELQLVLESSGFTIVESLRASLQAQGLQAELLGSSSDGSRSRSRLRVKA